MFDNLDDPKQQALLAAAFGLLGGGGGKGFGGFARDAGRAGLLGMQSFNQASALQDRRKEEEQQRQLREMQMGQMKQGIADQDFARQIAPNFFQTQNAPADGTGPVAPPKTDFAGYGQALAARNPQMGIPFIQAGMKDNTPLTVKEGETLLDRNSLKPVYQAAQKPHWVDAGDSIIPVGPDGKPVGAPIKKNMAPGEAQRLGLDQSRLGLEFARARDEGIGATGLSAKGQREIQQKVGEKGALDARQAQSDLPGVQAEAQQTIGLVNKLLEHPGLPDAVGLKGKGGIPTAVGLPPVPATNAADFMALKDQLVGKQFLQAFQSLKGGGQITEVEGKKATDAIARMNTAQSEKAFREAADEFRGVIATGLSRAQGKAGAAATPVFDGLSVTLPDGKTLRFPSDAAMRAFKKQAGL